MQTLARPFSAAEVMNSGRSSPMKSPKKQPLSSILHPGHRPKVAYPK